MKKLFTIGVLLLVSVLLILCAGCGNTNDPAAAVSATMAPTAEPTFTPEPTAEPTPEPVEATAEPVDDPAETDEPQEDDKAPEEENKPANNSGNSNSGNSNSGNSNKPAEPEQVVDKFSVAQDMTGKSVDELYAAIGQPNSSDYVASCLMPTGEDGLLYYDGFKVSTLRYPDGTELVMGAY